MKNVVILIMRQFKVINVDDETCDIGSVSISETSSPINAAKKLLRSIARNKKLEGKDKIKLKEVKYTIKETTRNSNKKEYGPYIGYYNKLTRKEMKDAQTANGSITFKMKPVVKLHRK